MIERVHEHIIEELNTNTRTDTLFVLAGIFLNLIILGINSGISRAGGVATDIVFYILILLLIVMNLVVETGLIKGRQSRKKLLEGLLRMYKDQGVEGYYDASLLGDYRTRYNLFMIVVLSFGFVALVVPFVVKLI
ncbi:MAG: hypothetical protein HYX80_03410 [Chloroflexi bacterium]|nr:hypothetical protein [Chloroflexota bacterium]